MKLHSYRISTGQLRTVIIHRPTTERDVMNRAATRHARRHGKPMMNWSDWFVTLRNARPEWLKREHAATDFLMQAQRARRTGNYGFARVVLADLAQWRKRIADARAYAVQEA